MGIANFVHGIISIGHAEKSLFLETHKNQMLKYFQHRDSHCSMGDILTQNILLCFVDDVGKYHTAFLSKTRVEIDNSVRF